MQLPLLLLVPDRERVRPVAWSVWRPLLVLAALGIVPWLVHAERMFASNRRNAGVLIGDVTMGVDHYAVQGALALALVALSLLAACWPRGRRYLGTSVGLCAGYVGLVSFAFPSTWAGLSPLWSVLCMAWAAAITAWRSPPPGYSRASSAARSSRPSEPCDSAAMCQALRSKSAPRACRAASRPSSQARSPSL